jgi:hypothetical protein
VKRWIILIAAIGLLIPVTARTRIWNTPAREVAEANAAPVNPLREQTTRLEEELSRKVQLRARGLAIDDEVDAAAVDLAKARHDAAVLANDRTAMLEQTRTILQVREREWQRVAAAVDRGILTPNEADDVRRRLAVARWRVAAEQHDATADEQLRQIAELYERKVERLGQAHARGAALLRELNAARYRASCARYELARTNGRKADVRREIDLAVRIWEQEGERVERLYQAGREPFVEAWLARWYLLDARLRRATLDRDRTSAAELTRLRIELVGEFLARLAPTDPFLQRLRPAVEWERARDQVYLDRLRTGGEFPPDSAAAMLDS